MKKDITLVIAVDDQGTVKIKKALGATEKEIEKYQKALGGSTKSTEGLGKETEKARTGFEKLKATLKGTVGQMAAGMGITMGLQMVVRKAVAAVQDFVKVTAEFEREWANTTTMLSVSEKETEALKGQLIGLSATLGSTSGMAKGMYQVLSASIEPAKAIGFLEKAAISAKAGVTDTAVAVDALTTVINAYGMEAEDVGRVSDVMFTTVKAGKLNYEQMAQALGTVVPIASQVGVSFEEVGAAMATMTRSGIDANTTTTQIRQILVSVLKPTKEAAEEAKRLGIDFSSAGLKAKGLAGFIAEVSEKSGGSVDSLTKMFGNVRALSGVMAIGGEAAAGFAKDLESMAGAGGATEEAFRKQMKSVDFWREAFGNAMDKAKIALWEGLVGPLKEGILSSEDFQKKFDEFTKGLIDAATKIGKAIYDITKFVIDHRKEILLVAGAYGGWYIWTKKLMALKFFGFLAGGMGSVNTLGRGIDALGAGFKNFNGSVNLAKLSLGKFALIAGTAYAAWNVGRWIGGLKLFGKSVDEHIQNAIEKYTILGVAVRKAEKELETATKGMKSAMERKNAAFKSASEFMEKEFRKSTTSIEEILALASNRFLDLGSTGNSVIDKWIKNWYIAEASVKGFKMTLATFEDDMKRLATEQPKIWEEITAKVDGFKKSLDEVPPVAGEAGDAIAEAFDFKELFKSVGVSLKSDLLDQLKNSETIIRDYKDQLSRGEEEKLRKQIEALRIELGLLDGTLKDLGVKTIEEVAKEVGELERKFGVLFSAYKDGTISQDQFRKGVEALDSAAKDFGNRVVVNAKGVQLLGRDFNAIIAPARNVAGVVEAIPKNFEKLYTSSRYLPHISNDFSSLQEAVDYLGISLADVAEKRLKKLEEAYRLAASSGKVSLQDQTKAAKLVADAYRDMGRAVPEEYRKIIKEGEKASRFLGQDFHDSVRTLMGAFSALSDGASESLGNLLRAASSVADQVLRYFQKIKESGESMNFGDMLKDIGPQLAGQLGGAIGGAISGSKGKDFGGIGSAIGGVLGSILPGIGNVIGSAVGGLLGGLFKKKEKKTEEQRADEQFKKQIEEVTTSLSRYGKISEETAKKIAESRKSMSGAAAEALHFADVIRDVGVKQENVNELWRGALGALAQYKEGGLDAAQATKSLGASFTELISGAQRLGTEGSKAMVDFIREVKASGLAVEEVTSYIDQQLGIVRKGAISAASGLLMMVDGIAPHVDAYVADIERMEKALEEMEPGTDAWKELSAELGKKKDEFKDMAEASRGEFARLERQTLATFNAMIENGASMSEAMEALGPTLSKIIEKQKALGIEAGAGIKELLRIREVTEANKWLFDSIEGNLAVLTSLGNVGALTQESFSDAAGQATDYYKRLQDAGLTGQEAMKQMVPTLEKLRFLSEEHGFVIDDATAALIRQADEQGLLKKKEMEMQDLLLGGFGLIIEALGGDIPAAMEKSIEKIREMEKAFAGSGVMTALEIVEDRADSALGLMDSLLDKNIDGITTFEDLLGSVVYTTEGLEGSMGGMFNTMNEGFKSAVMGARDLDRTLGKIDYEKLIASGELISMDDWLRGTKREAQDGGHKTSAASGFHGTVTGPRQFYIEPGVRERVDIGPSSEGAPDRPVEVNFNPSIYIEPIVFDRPDGRTVEFVMKKIERGDVSIPMRSVRG